MKKNEIRKLAILGLTTGLLVSSHLHAASSTTEQEKAKTDLNQDDAGSRLMTENELLLELTAEGKAAYQSLDAEGKALARKVASQVCNGQNVCKGLNACKTDKNECAGKGGCKGESKCAFTDKNLAVKVVQEKLMKEKRLNAIK